MGPSGVITDFRPPPWHARIAVEPLGPFFEKPGSAMDATHRDDLTALLGEVRAGHPDARARLVGAIYSELRRVAGERTSSTSESRSRTTCHVAHAQHSF